MYYRHSDEDRRQSFRYGGQEQHRSSPNPKGYVTHRSQPHRDWRNKGIDEGQNISYRGGQGSRRGRGGSRRGRYQGRQQQYHREKPPNTHNSRLYTNPRRYEHPCNVTFEAVSKLGHYSLDSNYKIHWNNYGMKFFTPEKCLRPSNVFEGFDEEAFDRRQALQKEYDKSYAISQMTEWMKLNQTKIKEKPDFVVKHFFLKKIMSSPYERFKGWTMEAVLHSGIIYLSKGCSDKDETLDLKSKMFMYGGSHFEDLVTTKTSVIDDECLPSDINRYYPVLRTKLYCKSEDGCSSQQGSFSILLSAEVDCVQGASSLTADDDVKNFVELKTTGDRDFNKSNHQPAPRWFKVLDWWAHCKLAGAPKICIGFRDNDGTLLDLVICASDDIPGIQSIRKQQNCVMNFLNEFLTFVKRTVTEDDMVYEVSFSPETSCIDVSRSKTDSHPLLSLLRDEDGILQ